MRWLNAALTERDPFLGSLMVFPAYEAYGMNQNLDGWHELKLLAQ